MVRQLLFFSIYENRLPEYTDKIGNRASDVTEAQSKSFLRLCC